VDADAGVLGSPARSLADLAAEVAQGHVQPGQVAPVFDAGRLAALRHAVFGEPAPPDPSPPCDRITHTQLRAAASFDPVAFRAMWGILAMIRQPAEVYCDPRVVARTQETLRQHDGVTAAPQPTREQLLLALAGGPAATAATA
jgi:hypothetical protein